MLYLFLICVLVIMIVTVIVLYNSFYKSKFSNTTNISFVQKGYVTNILAEEIYSSGPGVLSLKDINTIPSQIAVILSKDNITGSYNHISVLDDGGFKVYYLPQDTPITTSSDKNVSTYVLPATIHIDKTNMSFVKIGYVTNGKEVYYAGPGDLSLKDTKTIPSQVYNILSKNNITDRYNHISVWHDGGFRVYYIPDNQDVITLPVKNAYTYVLSETKRASTKTNIYFFDKGYITNVNHIYASGPGALSSIEDTNNIPSQVYNILSKNNITGRYNHISVWHDGGFRVYYIPDNQDVITLPDENISTYILSETKQLYTGYVTNGKEVYKSGARALSLNDTNTIPSQVYNILYKNKISDLYNHISVWGDGGFRAYYVPENTPVTTSSDKNISTHVLPETRQASTKKNMSFVGYGFIRVMGRDRPEYASGSGALSLEDTQTIPSQVYNILSKNNVNRKYNHITVWDDGTFEVRAVPPVDDLYLSSDKNISTYVVPLTEVKKNLLLYSTGFIKDLEPSFVSPPYSLFNPFTQRDGYDMDGAYKAYGGDGIMYFVGRFMSSMPILRTIPYNYITVAKGNFILYNIDESSELFPGILNTAFSDGRTYFLQSPKIIRLENISLIKKGYITNGKEVYVNNKPGISFENKLTIASQVYDILYDNNITEPYNYITITDNGGLRVYYLPEDTPVKFSENLLYSTYLLQETKQVEKTTKTLRQGRVIERPPRPPPPPLAPLAPLPLPPPPPPPPKITFYKSGYIYTNRFGLSRDSGGNIYPNDSIYAAPAGTLFNDTNENMAYRVPGYLFENGLKFDYDYIVVYDNGSFELHKYKNEYVPEPMTNPSNKYNMWNKDVDTPAGTYLVTYSVK